MKGLGFVIEQEMKRDFHLWHNFAGRNWGGAHGTESSVLFDHFVSTM